MGQRTKRRAQKGSRSTHLPPEVPADLRARLEAARFELLALFRALDQLQMAQSLPEDLQHLFELDADLAEALWALDQSPGRLNFAAMTRDTLASLETIPNAKKIFLDSLTKDELRRLSERIGFVRTTLRPHDAYNQIPGRDPQIG